MIGSRIHLSGLVLMDPTDGLLGLERWQMDTELWLALDWFM